MRVSVLNLRPEEPAAEVVEELALDETPPGLEAIRAWLRKPRPWLHGIRLWIREFGKWWRVFRKWAGENAVPAARRAMKVAERGAAGARHVAHAAEIAGQIGAHAVELGKEWRRGGGRIGRAGQVIAARAGKLREWSSRAIEGARSAAAIAETVTRFRALLPQREGAPAQISPEEEDSGPTRLVVPAPHRTPRNPRARQSREIPAPSPERASKRPAEPTEPIPEATEAPDGPETDSAESSLHERRAPAPEGPRRHIETSTPASSAPGPEESRRAELLAELPNWAQVRINALRPKTRKRSLWPLIVDILKVRGWTTSADLALILGVGSRNLARRHLVPLVEAGVLVRLYPEHPRHPEQAYRVKASAEPADAGRPRM